MPVIQSQQIKKVYYGNQRVKELWIGNTRIWPNDGPIIPYIELSKQFIWLMPSNNFLDYQQVFSNINWNVI